MKRIIEEKRQDGSVSYVVETKNFIFGWHTDTVYHELCPLDAVFDTLEEAKRFCGIDINPVVEREILMTI